MNLYRAFATVGGFTMLSRLLGFVRDILVAGLLGTGPVADAFVAAFRFPNLFRRIFGEGAFNAAFIPLFAKKLEGEGGDAARKFAEEALAVLLFALLVFTALAELAMPWLLVVMAPGFLEDPSKFDLTVALTRIAFPYLLCMSLVALLSGVLNALNRFAAAAAAPVLLNIVLIAAMSLAWSLGFQNQPNAGYLLALGVAIAGALQLALLAIAAQRAGMGLTLRRPRITPDVKRFFKLGVPGVIAGGVTQINIVVGTMIASMQAGAVAYLYYADRLYQLPLGIIGIAIGVVLLPDISRLLRAGEYDAVSDSQNRSLEFALLLTLPAAVALFVVPEPIIRVLFERGAFTADDSAATALGLSAFALGLPAFVLIKIFSPAYFAREDTRTPMIYAAVGMVVNVIGSLLLFFWLRSIEWPPHVGIAAASALAGWVNAGMLWSTLRVRGHFDLDRQTSRAVPRIILSSLAMGGVLWVGATVATPWFAPEAGFFAQFTALAGLVMGGLIVFALAVELSGAADLRGMARTLKQPRRATEGHIPEIKD
ncbi:MAG: murein biosynthesis integral membrane protein MurJ [Pseudomonadota bacterium]